MNCYLVDRFPMVFPLWVGFVNLNNPLMQYDSIVHNQSTKVSINRSIGVLNFCQLYQFVAFCYLTPAFMCKITKVLVLFLSAKVPMIYPLVNIQKLWKITIFNGKTHYKWPFSIATLNYQRVELWTKMYHHRNPIQ